MPRLSLTSLIRVDRLHADRETRYQFVASDAECDELAQRFGFVTVSVLSADLYIVKSARDCWDVRGRLSASVIQACGVTGDPVPETVDFPIEERYVRSAGDPAEVEVRLDDAEPLQDGAIDIGEMLAQSLSLAVTSWPRAPHAPDILNADESLSDHPFAGLAALKSRRSE